MKLILSRNLGSQSKITYWTAVYPETVSVYSSIEEAAPHLLEFGIYDDEIDLALISLYANNHDKATFEDGKFVASV